jgi:glycerol-3-phosphate dehydrogenase
VLDARDTTALFPEVDRLGLKGGAVWYDAVMPSSVRVLIETLNWARHNGAIALNYVECTDTLEADGKLAGVRACDRPSGSRVEFSAPLVVNCAGPWSRVLSERLDRERESLFHPSLAFNVLLDRRPLSAAAVAVAPRRTGARTYFLRPWRNRIFAGTFHAPCTRYPAASAPDDALVERFLANLNEAVPALELTREDIVRTYSGLLPAVSPGTEDLATRPALVDHGRDGGPKGLWSVSGVKYTTARRVAEHTLRRVFERSGRDLSIRPESGRPPVSTSLDLSDPSALATEDRDRIRVALERLVEDECVLCMEDLLLRRTDWGTDPEAVPEVAIVVRDLLGSKLPDRVVPDDAAAGADI